MFFVNISKNLHVQNILKFVHILGDGLSYLPFTYINGFKTILHAQLNLKDVQKTCLYYSPPRLTSRTAPSLEDCLSLIHCRLNAPAVYVT